MTNESEEKETKWLELQERNQKNFLRTAAFNCIHHAISPCNCLSAEIERYIRYPVIDDENPLKWWQCNKHELPFLSQNNFITSLG